MCEKSILSKITKLSVLTASSVKIYNAERREVHREVFNVTWDADAAEKEGYDHFMLKEIHEQPKGIRNTITRRNWMKREISFSTVFV